MLTSEVLGMPLDQALEALRAQGEGAGKEWRVTVTQAPRTTRSGGTLRVVCVRKNELICAAFMDGEPREACDQAQ